MTADVETTVSTLLRRNLAVVIQRVLAMVERFAVGAISLLSG